MWPGLEVSEDSAGVECLVESAARVLGWSTYTWLLVSEMEEAPVIEHYTWNWPTVTFICFAD